MKIMHKVTYTLLLIIFSFVTTTANAQSNVERANQIVKTLLPDEKITVHNYGITVEEVVLYFEKETPELPIITVSEENELYIHLCCVTIENEETVENEITQLSAYSYPLESAQLPLAKELKTLIESIRSGK